MRTKELREKDAVMSDELSKGLSVVRSPRLHLARLRYYLSSMQSPSMAPARLRYVAKNRIEEESKSSHHFTAASLFCLFSTSFISFRISSLNCSWPSR